MTIAWTRSGWDKPWHLRVDGGTLCGARPRVWWADREESPPSDEARCERCRKLVARFVGVTP